MNFLKTLLRKTPTFNGAALAVYDAHMTAAIEASFLNVELIVIELMLAELQYQGKMPSDDQNAYYRPPFRDTNVAQTLDRFRADVRPFISHNPTTLDGYAEWDILSVLHAELKSYRNEHPPPGPEFSAYPLPFSEELLLTLVLEYGPFSMAEPSPEHLEFIAAREYGNFERMTETQQANALAPHAGILRRYALERDNGPFSRSLRSLTGANSWVKRQTQTINDSMSLRRATALYDAGTAYMLSRRMLRELLFVYREAVFSASYRDDGTMNLADFAQRKDDALKRWTDEDHAYIEMDNEFFTDLRKRAVAAEGLVRKNFGA